jgi:type II secretory pathway pseudopilin PulG
MRRFGTYSSNRRVCGFSLIEICVVTMLGGIALTAFLDIMKQYRAQQVLAINNERIATIQKALTGYFNENSHLPCVAPRNVAVGTATFGVAQDCDPIAPPPPPGSMAQAPGTGGRIVRIGAVPVRALGLSDDYAADSWGNLFTYAVTESLATPAIPFNAANGAVNIMNPITGGSEVTPPGSAFYAVVGHGQSGNGAWTTAGVQSSLCPAVAVTYDDRNCQDTATFASVPLSTAATAAHFDDQLIYVNTANAIILPTCLPNQVLTSTDGSTITCVVVPPLPVCNATQRLTSTDGITLTCADVPDTTLPPPACIYPQYLTRLDATHFTCTGPAPGTTPPPPLPDCGTTQVLRAVGGVLVCKTPVIDTVVRSCSMNVLLPGSTSSYKCTIGCPSGYVATGGGMDQSHTHSNKGHSLYNQDGSTGTYVAGNYYRCASDAGTCINGWTGGATCGMRCYVTCARIIYQ